MEKEELNSRYNIKKVITYIAVLLIVVLGIISFMKIISSSSFGADNQQIKLESKLQKYINFKISDQDKGTLVQYDIKAALEYQEQQYIPVKQSQIKLEFGQIQGNFPYAVKVVAKSTAVTKGQKI